MKPELSIIIPTLNEEKYLPELLESIKKQSYKDYEIIVADGNSSDGTQVIAKKQGCKVVKGVGHPSVGRNNGAKAASGRYFLFLDSDVILTENFLSDLLRNVKVKGTGTAGCFCNPLSDEWFDKSAFVVTNWYNKVWEKMNPHAPGWCIITKKSIFNKTKGFNEKLYLAEDHDYVKRARKFGKFTHLRNPKVFVSLRRMDEEGRLKTIIKYIYCEIYLLFKKSVKEDIYKYKFGKHR